MLKFLARRSVVGKTTRVVGKTYIRFMTHDPNYTHSVILKGFVELRYPGIQMEKYVLLEIIKNQPGIGLLEFIVNILRLEANFDDNTSENRLMFMNVIFEELLRLGLSESVIRGSSFEEE